MKTFYVTTPIYYVNDIPHIGHAYTTIMADVIARYRRAEGYQTYFLTGTDEHGQKIEKSAAAQGITPKALADRVVERFKELWKTLDIRYDRFIRTTDNDHVAGVQHLFRRVLEKGDIYPGDYKGHYCISCENYVPETADDAPGGNKICPDCGKETELLTERCYFFRLSAYQDRLLDFYEKNPDFIRPASRMNEVVSFVKMGLKDLSITRSTVKWGVPVPDDPEQTIYVWFDALSNYITAMGYPEKTDNYSRFWPADLHVMAKDILRFHAVYWPAFLLAAGLELPKRELIHGWWLKDEKKMSKSRGNVLDPRILLKHFPADAIRYFMMREAPIGADANFSHQGFITRINTELANDWANLISRVGGMISRYLDNHFPGKAEYSPAEYALEQDYLELEKEVRSFFDNYTFNRGLERIMEYVNRLNRYIVEAEPWKMAGDESRRPALEAVLKTLVRAILSTNTLLAPVIPKSSARVREFFNHSNEDFGWKDPGEVFQVNNVEPLFPRVDPKVFFAEELEAKEKSPKETPMTETPQTPAVPEGIITFDEFKKVRMVVALVEAAEKVEKTDKLLRLTVNTGSDTRTLVAGVAQYYSPEELVGRKIIIVANLKPATIRGIESRGMILAATDADRRPYIPHIPEDTPIGSIMS